LAAPIAIALLVWLLKNDEHRIQKKILRVILPLGIIVTVTIAAMALYFWKTTGQPFRPPYLVYERTYMSTPSFPWLPPKPMPSYSSPAMRNFYEGSAFDAFNFAVHHPLSNIFLRIFFFWLFLPGTDADGPISDAALHCPSERNFRTFRQPCDFSCWLPAFHSRNVVASHFLAALRCAGYCLVYAFVLWTMRYIRPLFFGRNLWAWELLGQSWYLAFCLQLFASQRQFRESP